MPTYFYYTIVALLLLLLVSLPVTKERFNPTLILLSLLQIDQDYMNQLLLSTTLQFQEMDLSPSLLPLITRTLTLFKLYCFFLYSTVFHYNSYYFISFHHTIRPILLYTLSTSIILFFPSLLFVLFYFHLPLLIL